VRNVGPVDAHPIICKALLSAMCLEKPPLLIIAVAPNGAHKSKKDHSAIPVSPQELASEVASCVDTGAAMIHLHVRDSAGGHSLDSDSYKTAIAAIRSEVGQRVIIQVTSESVGKYSVEEQMAMVRSVKPEAVSLAVREIFPPGCDEVLVSEFLAWVASERIMPQYIMFSTEDFDQFMSLRLRGIVPEECLSVLFVLGRYSKYQQSSPKDLLQFLCASHNVSMEWFVCAFGAEEGSCALSAVTLGGHCRVGFENNIFLADGTVAPNNSALVKQVCDGAALICRPVADADSARSLLGFR